MKILLNEGCPIFRAGMKYVLIEEGYQVDDAQSREDLYKMFSPKYDIIILDLDSLGSGAIELANVVESSLNFYSEKLTKVIATYKDSPEYYMAHMFDAGIKKPFTKEKLLQIINKEKVNVERFNNKRNSPVIRHNYSYSMVQNKA